MATIDRIFDSIDTGLQHSTEFGQGVGDGCVRCTSTDLAGGGGLCQPCRAYLLGDTDHDPAQLRAGLADNESRRRTPLWAAAIGRVIDGRSLAELLDDGDAAVWLEDDRLLTGEEALAHVAAVNGVAI